MLLTEHVLDFSTEESEYFFLQNSLIDSNLVQML